MKPKLVTFDCAQTLLEVDWELGKFALRCAREAGLDLDEAAADLYAELYRPKHLEYLELNLTRNADRCNAFWADLSNDWLSLQGHDPERWQPRIEVVSQEIGFGPRSQVFRPYADVVSCLDLLQALGVRAAIISNWDYSLHIILRSLGLYDRFELVVASLEEGFEKPDPRIFLQTLKKLGVEPSEATHVGDDPLDDLQGAKAVGMRAVLIDRSLQPPVALPYITSLTDLPGALGWSE